MRIVLLLVTAGCCNALFSREGTRSSSGPTPLPHWKPTYNMSLSTVFMPCNDSGFMDPSFSALWGLVDFDWSNGKQDWANQKPMDCQERLLKQAEIIKQLTNETKVMVYR